MANRCGALLSDSLRDFGMSPASIFVKQGLVRELLVYEDYDALLRAGWVSGSEWYEACRGTARICRLLISGEDSGR